MATHARIPACELPRPEEPGGLRSKVSDTIRRINENNTWTKPDTLLLLLLLLLLSRFSRVRLCATP